jgi:hypothetical protein
MKREQDEEAPRQKKKARLPQPLAKPVEPAVAAKSETCIPNLVVYIFI